MRVLSLALGTWLATGVAVADDAADYARRLSTLRTEVEQLSESLDLEREALRSDLRASEIRKAELEARIRQQELRLAELEREVERQRSVLDGDSAATEALEPVLTEAMGALRAQVAGSLPYRRDERLGAIDSLLAKVQDGTLDIRRAMGRGWQLVEDELRLTRENVLDRQVITVDGSDVLCDVVRVGTLALYFRTEDERFGQAVREGDDWRWVLATAPEDQVLLAELFDAVKKQIRVGWFDLPWALPEVSR